ncbi:MAG: glycosyltransferase family 4 protein [Verrucomicrobiota bacterium]
MRRPLVIVSPLLPPLHGGLADHTHELARHLQEHFAVSVVSTRDVYTSAPFQVRAVIHDWDDGFEIWQELSPIPPDAVILWQYVPHMYGRGGVNRALPKLWKALKDQGRHQVILAHEIAAPWGNRPNHWWYAYHHRRQWKAALACADLIPFSTEAWLEEWSARERKRADRFFLLPSPTSIPVEAVPADHRQAWRAKHGIPDNTRVLLWFGTVNVTKQLPWVVNAWEAANRQGTPTVLGVIGGNPPLAIPGGLRERYRAFGYLPPEDVSRALHAADLLVLPFVDGASERRTTLMAGLAHGVAVLSTVGHNTGDTLAGADFIEATPADQPAEFIRQASDLLRDPAELDRLAQAGRAQYAQAYSWPVVVKTLRERLAAIGLD